MSVNVEVIVGYTTTLAKDLTSEDYELFEKFLSAHPEYELSKRKGKGPVRLVVDGMNGAYARLVYIDKRIDDIYDSDSDYEVLSPKDIPLEIFKSLCEVYEELYGTDKGILNPNRVEYAFWFHYS